ncbi:MAG: MBL fold metallo-hydrolase [Firmicutes bacterium]|nr:MBL fold metallo-hydrolase [Bacillota bacterium]
MKLTFVGTGAAQTERRLSSYVIDDQILFDIGYGTVNVLKEYGLVDKIRTIIISHFHNDHVGDLALFLYRRSEMKDKLPLTIIGPKGLWRFLEELYKLVTFEDDVLYDGKMRYFALDTIKIVELDNNEAYKDEYLSVKAFNAWHGHSKYAKGYVLETGGKKFGCTGDTALCDALVENLPLADAWIVDCAHVVAKDERRHLGLDQIKVFASTYPEKNFFCVHRKEWEPPTDLKNVFFPMDGEIVEV